MLSNILPKGIALSTALKIKTLLALLGYFFCTAFPAADSNFISGAHICYQNSFSIEGKHHHFDKTTQLSELYKWQLSL
jgi:hypothetical protein